MQELMFDELKAKCLEVWKKYEDRPWDYYEEKVTRVNRAGEEDAGLLIRMFDWENQKELWEKLSPECREVYEKYFR